MRKEMVISLLCILISIIFGIISNDLLIGIPLLLTSLLGSYLSSIGKKSNFIFAIINCLLIGYVGLKNHLYGYAFFYPAIFIPFQIYGYISWRKNTTNNKLIKRSFNFKNSIIIICLCVISSFVVGYLLSIIPKEHLAFMDSTSNCLTLCATILMMLRFKESWWLWFINNTVDLIIWIDAFINKGSNSFMMLIVSISYLLINIYGLYEWYKKEEQ